MRAGCYSSTSPVAPVWFLVLLCAFLITGKLGLGIVLPVSILVSNVPQLLVAMKEDELSLGTWLFSVSDGLVWGLYALIANDPSILIVALLQFRTSGIIVGLKLLDKGKVRKRLA